MKPKKTALQNVGKPSFQVAWQHCLVGKPNSLLRIYVVLQGCITAQVVNDATNAAASGLQMNSVLWTMVQQYH